MFKKVMAGVLVLSVSTLFGMSLNKLNTASKSELMEINGIGEKKADAIIKERRKGKFKSFEDFQRVEGIGEETAKNVKNDVKVKKDIKSSKKPTKKSTKSATAKKSSTKKKK
ncbi:ComEA family DNA-binding protein [Sulfurovum riftiae]|uniref:Transporter n=1 Tax=Sulfurovum riftiae TaxID=1630136 RepID=A0A151CHC7_9BACT|nr:helix-hairpin-helix domain-containing protein [Sulfurovum riftiae]KYJ86911.1 transporter [Sulfurovum riftiae]